VSLGRLPLSGGTADWEGGKEVIKLNGEEPGGHTSFCCCFMALSNEDLFGPVNHERKVERTATSSSSSSFFFFFLFFFFFFFFFTASWSLSVVSCGWLEC